MSTLPPFGPGDPGGATDLVAFVGRHRRLPRLGDPTAPWRYRGWLLPYVVRLHALVPAVADRWGYHLSTLGAGRLLDTPIPQIAFGPADHKVFGLLRDWSRLIGRDCGGWSDFRALLGWLGWGLALGVEEPRLGEGVNEKLYPRVGLGPLLARPHDYLGEWVAANKAGGWNPTGFYPTSHPVAECMARLALHADCPEGRDPRTRRVCDPCCGSGRLLLHASNDSLCLSGQDIDPLAVLICKINGALYAPWLAFPLPAFVTGSVPDPPPPGSPSCQAP